MYSSMAKCIYQDDNYELIINETNKQIVLLERLFSERVRSSKDFFELKRNCKIEEKDAENFENTYQYLVSNGFVESVDHECFKKSFISGRIILKL